MRRLPFLLVAVLVALATVGAGCASTTQPNAATVGSSDITRRELNDDLDELAANEKLVDSAAASGTEFVTSDGAVSMQVASQWLGSLVNQALVDQEFERRGLEVTAENRQAAEQGIQQSLGGAEIFSEFSEAFRQRLIERQARLEAVRGDLAEPEEPTDAELAAFGQQACPSGRLVEHILVADAATAANLKSQLDSGADFATLAAQSSTDTQSAQRGGQLGCLAQGQFVAAFEQAAFALGAGQVSEPVQTEFGFHLIRVKELDRQTLLSAYQQQQADPLSGVLARAARRTKVWVDPRYGTVEKTEEGVSITPPEAPSPREEPASSSTTPGGITDPTAPTPTP